MKTTLKVLSLIALFLFASHLEFEELVKQDVITEKMK